MKIKCINAEKMNLKYGKWTQDKEYNVIEEDDGACFVADDNKTTWWVGIYFLEVKY